MVSLRNAANELKAYIRMTIDPDRNSNPTEEDIRNVEETYAELLSIILDDEDLIEETRLYQFDPEDILPKQALRIYKEVLNKEQRKLEDNLPQELKRIKKVTGKLVDGMSLDAYGVESVTYYESSEDNGGISGGYWPKATWVDPRTVMMREESKKVRELAERIFLYKFGVSPDSKYISGFKYSYDTIDEEKYYPSGKAAEYGTAHISVKYRIWVHAKLNLPPEYGGFRKEDLVRAYFTEILERLPEHFTKIRSLYRRCKDLNRKGMHNLRILYYRRLKEEINEILSYIEAI